jgi:hypothetical protein
MMEIYRLIDKVLAQTATQTEQAWVNDWINSHPDNRNEFDNLKLLYQLSRGIDPAINKDNIQKIKATIKNQNAQFKNRIMIGILTIILMVSISRFYFNAGQPINDQYLIANQTSLDSIVQILSSHYHVPIFINDNIEIPCILTGRIDLSETVTDCLESLSWAVNLTYEINSSQEIWITAPCQTQRDKFQNQDSF